MTGARVGYGRGARWPRRVGSAGATAAVLAMLAALWWLSGPFGGVQVRIADTPLALILPTPPRPPERPRPPPPPVRARPAVRQGGRVARNSVADPVEPAPFRLAGADRVRPITQPAAPPLVSAATEQPVMIDATPVGPAGPPSTGPGDDAGRGTGHGAGNGSGDGTGDGAGTERIYVRPDWVVKPDETALRPYWPYMRGIPVSHGRTALACRVRLSTRVENCRVLAESPARSGFGRASLIAAHIFRIRPPKLNGSPVDRALVLVTIDWTVLPPPGRPGKRSPPSPTAPPMPPTSPTPDATPAPASTDSVTP